jgi:hypothetical protein
MATMIKHGTWAIVPITFALGFLYLHVSAKVFPRRLARHDDAADGRRPEPPAE